MALEDTPLLGCGRSIDGIWAALDAPAGPHEQQCAQCQEARTRLLNLRQATEALREAELHDPSLRPRSSLKDSIMGIARAEVRRTRPVSLQRGDGGYTDISENALASVVRRAADRTPGIHARRCRIEVTSTPGPFPSDTVTQSATVLYNKLVINLRVAAAPNLDIPRTVSTLRERIAVSIARSVGVCPLSINITVEDLYDVER